MFRLRLPPGLRWPASLSLADRPTTPALLLDNSNASQRETTTRPGSERSLKWVEGLRGVAALLVITCHFCAVCDETLIWPQDAEDVPPRFWQQPIIRILASGRPSVAMFTVLIGFTNALRPLKLSYNGEGDKALFGLSRSTAKRAGQLIFPCMAATVLNWVLCELGAFEFAFRTSSWWIHGVAPRPLPTFPQAVYSLFNEIVGTWTNERNGYDAFQWCMAGLLRASMWVYLVLVATVRCRPSVRVSILVLLLFYSIRCRDVLCGLNAYSGLLLAELFVRPGSIFSDTLNRPIRNILVPCLVFGGAYIASYPEKHVDWTPWSNELYQIALTYFPANTDVGFLFTSMGTIIAMCGVVMSPTIKRWLEHPFLLKAGKMSLAIFLSHGMIIKSVFPWLVFGLFSKVPVPPVVPGEPLQPVDPKAEIPLPTKPYCFVACMMTFVVIWFNAHLWTIYVDPACSWACDQIETWMFAKEDTPSGLPLPVQYAPSRPDSPMPHYEVYIDSPTAEKAAEAAARKNVLDIA